MATDLVGFTDVCCDGTRVSAPWGDGAPAELHVQEPGQPVQVIALPDRAIYVSAERCEDGALVIAWNSQSDGQPGRWWRSDTDEIQTLELLHGEYPVIVTPDGWIEYMPAAGGGRSTVTLWPTGERTSHPCALTSQGFAGYDDDWTAIWMDSVMSVMLGGITFARAWRHGDWTVGGDVHADRVLAYHHPTSTPYVVANVATPIGPRARTLDDGSAVCAISLPGLWVPSASFAAYTAPPAKIPTFAAQQASVLVIGDHDSPEQIAARFDQDPISPKTKGVFATLGSTDFDRAAALAAAQDAPLYAYRDGPTLTPADVPTIHGVTVIPTLRCYPETVGGVLVDPKTRIADVVAQAMTLAAAGHQHLAVVLPCYRQTHGDGTYSWPLSHVLALVGAAVPAMAGLVRVWIGFEQSRGTDDGIAHIPEIATMVARLRSACSLPAPVVTHQPPPAEPEPPAQPPPVKESPVPDTPSVPPPPPTKEAQLAAYHAPREQSPGPGYVWMAGHWNDYGAGASSASASMAANAAAQSATPSPAPASPSVLPVTERVHVDGPIFRTASGQPWRWCGASAFVLPMRWCNGEDITPVLDELRALGVNTLRCFLQHKFMLWPDIVEWITPIDRVRPFVDFLGQQGFSVELTILCDCENDTGDGYVGFNQSHDWQVGRVRDVIAAVAGTPNVFVEIGNEPPSNGCDVVRIAQDLDLFDPANRPMPMAVGLYPITGNEPNFPVLDYVADHPERKRDWTVETGKTGDYVYRQTGRPWVADEWAKFSNPDNPDGEATECDPVQSPRRAEEGGAGCALSGAGYTFHSVSGIHAVPLTPLEHECCARAMTAMALIPLDAATGDYTHDGMDNNPLEPVPKEDRASVAEVAGRVQGDHGIEVGAMPTTWNPIARDGWRIAERKLELGQLVFLER